MEGMKARRSKMQCGGNAKKNDAKSSASNFHLFPAPPPLRLANPWPVAQRRGALGSDPASATHSRRKSVVPGGGLGGNWRWRSVCKGRVTHIRRTIKQKRTRDAMCNYILGSAAIKVRSTQEAVRLESVSQKKYFWGMAFCQNL